MAAVIALVLMLAPLAERHRAFVEDEAHFLLTDAERERFLELESDEARDRFVEGFWRQRDRTRHIERLRACDRLFGARGRWSARGRVYQLLGAPSFREDFTRAGNRLVPSELWHYTGVGLSFLPDSFYLVFFRNGEVTEFRLWNPVTDGVTALVPDVEPGSVMLGEYHGLGQIDPELALAVEGLVPGGSERDAMSLLANLDALPALLERERAYGEDVRVAVATRALPVRLTSAVLVDDVGVCELHYALDVAAGASESFRWRSRDGRFHVGFTLVGRVIGQTSFEGERWEDVIELDVTEREKRALVATRLSFRGRRVVAPSDRRFELALVTEGAGTVVDAPVTIPGTTEENEARARKFELDLSSPPGLTRVLDRERTADEEGRYRFMRGAALVRNGESGRAIAELERASELLVDDVRIHVELARLLYASQRYRDVMKRLKTVAARFPDEVDVWVLLAGSAEALGLMDDAMRYYDRALSISPENAAIAAARERLH